MTENDLLAHWTTARWHIIVSQLAPTFLLAVTVWMLIEGLAETPLPVRLGATSILLASIVLGAVALLATAHDGLAALAMPRALPTVSAIGARVIASARGVDVVRFVGPAIFAAAFAAFLWALFL